MNNFLLEVCTDSVEASLTAFHAGADRLELCSSLIIGGTTRSLFCYRGLTLGTRLGEAKYSVLCALSALP